MPEMFYKLEYEHRPTMPYSHNLRWLYDYGSYSDSGYRGEILPVTTHYEAWKYCVRYEIEDRFGHEGIGRWGLVLEDGPHFVNEITFAFVDKTDCLHFALWLKGQTSTTLWPLFRNYPY